jgi:hypothetical protein
MSDRWKAYVHLAGADLRSAYLAKNDAQVLADLRDAAENIYKAIDALENKPKQADQQSVNNKS